MSHLDIYRDDMAKVIRRLETATHGAGEYLAADLLETIEELVSEWGSMDGEIDTACARICELEDTEAATIALEEQLNIANRKVDDRDEEIDEMNDRIRNMERAIRDELGV